MEVSKCMTTFLLFVEERCKQRVIIPVACRDANANPGAHAMASITHFVALIK